MSTMTYAVSDSLTMLRRSVRHGIRYPLMLISGLATPIILLLVFVYIFGSALGAGVEDVSAGRLGYLKYIAPSMLLLTVCYGGGTTAVTVSVDLTQGIVNRFRTMSISRGALLVGHVVGGVIRTMAAVVLVLGVALLIGYRSDATPLEWLAALGLLTFLAFALSWLMIAFGSAAKSPGGANTAALPLQLLPLLSSAFVPTAGMPSALRAIAQYQPFTPIIDTLRGLLGGAPIGNNGIVALCWCTGISIVGFVWSTAVFNRRGRTGS
jgi:ABC-2 type transport system permease protein